MLLLIVAVIWWWRSRQSGTANTSQAAKPASPEPLEMVRCSHCGMHIPGHEAVAGNKGLYCSASHCQQAET